MISISLDEFLRIDLAPMLTALFAASACALVGSFLLVRKLSLMGDAISHSVLPGIVVGFLISGSRATLPIVLGAACAGVLTTLLVELVRKLGRLESGASMGVVFSIFFALGVLLIEQGELRGVDLDADCLLHGQLESIFLHVPGDRVSVGLREVFQGLPSEVWRSFSIFVSCLLVIVLFYKELVLSAFDPALSSSLGFSANKLHILLMVLVAATVVASFEAVGSILVIAMLICPPATARMLTDSMRGQLFLSVLISSGVAIGGYLLAAFGLSAFNIPFALNGAVMIASLSGVVLLAAVFLAPRYGIIANSLRRFRLSLQVRKEDALGLLYRLEELQGDGGRTDQTIDLRQGVGGGLLAYFAIRALRVEGKIVALDRGWRLTELGRQQAESLVRSHRLWETYLVEEIGLRADHVHDRATELEHFTDSDLSQKLSSGMEHPPKDPHGKRIPTLGSSSSEDEEISEPN